MGALNDPAMCCDPGDYGLPCTCKPTCQCTSDGCPGCPCPRKKATP